ncbi:MAG: hypothetical protein KAW92_10590 [Candidatus Cloacimonetes bacterium]|nr:hypothetical protein [Candidatus Cloacimonadota bacterium]
MKREDIVKDMEVEVITKEKVSLWRARGKVVEVMPGNKMVGVIFEIWFDAKELKKKE